MLYSILVGVFAYYAVLFVIGILINATAIEGSLIALATIALIGGYLARGNQFVRRLASWIGGIAIALVAFTWVVLPVLQVNGNFWVKILSLIAGLVCYIVSRRYWSRRYLIRDRQTQRRPDPPLGREWVRWIVLILA